MLFPALVPQHSMMAEGGLPPLVNPGLVALPVIAAVIAERPGWQVGEPLAVPLDLYVAAEAEMRHVMNRRGLALPVSDEMAHARHFVFRGTPVVIGEDADG